MIGLTQLKIRKKLTLTNILLLSHIFFKKNYYNLFGLRAAYGSSELRLEAQAHWVIRIGPFRLAHLDTSIQGNIK
jgi:hypothetical protein